MGNRLLHEHWHPGLRKKKKKEFRKILGQVGSRNKRQKPLDGHTIASFPGGKQSTKKKISCRGGKVRETQTTAGKKIHRGVIPEKRGKQNGGGKRRPTTLWTRVPGVNRGEMSKTGRGPGGSESAGKLILPTCQSGRFMAQIMGQGSLSKKGAARTRPKWSVFRTA